MNRDFEITTFAEWLLSDLNVYYFANLCTIVKDFVLN